MNFERLYVQYQPTASTLTELVTLQNRLHDEAYLSHRRAAESLHCTIVHYGKVLPIYDDLRAVNPSLSKAVYQTALNQFIQACQAVCPSRMSVMASTFALFGNGSALVLLLEQSTDLMRIQVDCVRALEQLMVACGVTDPQQYLAQDANFATALSFRPHILLGRQPVHLPAQLDKPLLLELQRMSFTDY